jgi:hypothetical protein
MTGNTPRPLFDSDHPQFVAEYGFVRWPWYRVQEAQLILGLSDDTVRRLFRSLRYGPILEPTSQEKGKRRWRQLLIPFETLAAFIERHLKLPDGYNGSRLVSERRLAITARIKENVGSVTATNR